MSAELRPEAMLPAAALALCIQVLVAWLAVRRTYGARDLRTRLGSTGTELRGPGSDRGRREGVQPGPQGAGGFAATCRRRLPGLDLPATALFCLAAAGGLLGLLAGQLLGLSGSGCLLICASGASAVVAWRCAGNASRMRRLGPAVYSFLREVHLSAVAGETAGRALGHASERAADAIRPLVHQAWLAVQAGEDLAVAYGGLQPLGGLASYQGFLYALWLHEQTAASLGELLGAILQQTEEELLARRELAARLGEAKWTARVLAVVPAALLGYMLLAQPDLVAPLTADPTGRQAMAAGAILWLAGLGVSAYVQRPPRGLRREL